MNTEVTTLDWGICGQHTLNPRCTAALSVLNRVWSASFALSGVTTGLASVGSTVIVVSKLHRGVFVDRDQHLIDGEWPGA